MHNPKFDLILLAAGRGRRLGNHSKASLIIKGRTFLQYLLDIFSDIDGLSNIVITHNRQNYSEILGIIDSHFLKERISLVRGGRERVFSVYNALMRLKSSPSEIIIIHDIARPNISPNVILNGLQMAHKKGSAIPAIPLVDTIKKVEKDRITQTIPRGGIYQIQTPQFFNKELITYAYDRWFKERTDQIPTDDSYLLEVLGISLFTIEGSRSNIKVTYKGDLEMINNSLPFRIGFGYDIHRLKSGGKLYIGGVMIDETRSAIAHSDGDALLHSICDAMLGGCGLKDIGHYFPTKDEKYKGISSLILLDKTSQIISKEGYYVVNLDSSIILQTPKIAKHIDEMKKNISRILKIPRFCIGIKATTPERLDEANNKRSVAAYTTILLKSV